MSRAKSKTKRVSHPTNNVSSSPANNSKTAEPCLTITSKKSQLYISCFDFEGVCPSRKRHARSPTALLPKSALSATAHSARASFALNIVFSKIISVLG
jgi:hypothetical protein